MIDGAGFRAAFLLLAFLPLVAWLLVRRARELPPEPVPAGPRGPAWELLRDAGMRRLLTMNWLMTSSWDLHAFMGPVLGHESGLPASVIGTILGVFAIGAAVVRLGLPTIAGRVREWVLVTGATAIARIGFLVYPLSRSALVMGLCSAVIGTSLGAVQPMIMSMLHQITPRHRHGEALAVRLILVNLSSVGMPLLFGVFWTMGALVSVGSRLGVGLRGVRDEGHGP
jgi:predicted MFS family arabinose efflux permease